MQVRALFFGAVASGAASLMPLSTGKVEARAADPSIVKARVAAQSFTVDQILDLVDACVSQRLAPNVEIGDGKARINYYADELTDADRLNGITQRGWLEFEEPVRFGKGEWQEGVVCLTYIRQHGRSTVDIGRTAWACHQMYIANSFVNDDYDPPVWPCVSRG
jgi:hypothetical protein